MREEDKALIAKVLLNHYEILKLIVRQTWWLFVSIVGLAWWLLWMLMTMLARVNHHTTDHTTDVVKRDQQQQQQQTRLHAEDMLSSKKWLSINDNHQLVIDEDVGQRVLTTPTTKPQLGGGGVNLAMVFGPLGSGKSFLMNCLAEQSGNKEKCFAVSNMTEACTQGVDICSPFHFFPPTRRSTTTTTIPTVFCDLEGMGDAKGQSYEMRLSAPVLLTSQVTILNVIRPTRVDKDMLGLLTLAVNTAREIAGDNASGSQQEEKLKDIFGHLHIVLRDTNQPEDPKDINQLLKPTGEKCLTAYEILFNDEPVDESSSRSSIVASRNEDRALLRMCFSSIKVWSVPPARRMDATGIPVSPTSLADTPPAFQSKLAAMHAVMAQQLSQPRYFAGQSLTAPLLRDLMPQLVARINARETIAPSGVLEAMKRMQVLMERVKTTAVDRYEPLKQILAEKPHSNEATLSVLLAGLRHDFTGARLNDWRGQNLLPGTINMVREEVAMVVAHHEESLWKVNTEALFHLAIQSAADTAKLRARNMWQDKEAKYPVSDSGLATTAAGIEQECTALFTKQLVNAAPPGRRDPDVCKSALPPDVTVALADMHSNATLLNEIKKRDRATEAQAAAKLKRDEEERAATAAALNARAEKLEEREKAANEQAVKLERDERAAADEKQRREEEARNRTASNSPTYMFSSSSSEHDLFSSSSSDRSSDSGSPRSSIIVGISKKGIACKICLKGHNCPHHPRRSSRSDSGSPRSSLVVGITDKGNACKICLKGHRCRWHS